MKIIYRILLLMIFLASIFQGFAYDVKLNDICYNLNQEEGTASITSNNRNYEGDITIPSTISYQDEQYIVTEIENRAFYNCDKLISIVLPNSITVIGESVFENCRKLISIVMPEFITVVGDRTFFGCESLVSVDLPDSLTEIGSSAFSSCSSLVSIDFPDSLIKIGAAAFSSCNSLGFIELPDSLTEIGINAFGYCNSLLINKLPDSLKIIGSGAFFKSLKNESIFIPASIEYIGPGALFSESLTEVNVSPDNAYYASEDGILYNKDLTILLYCPTGKSGEVKIPDSVKEIYGDKNSGLQISMNVSGAFSQCKKITSVVFGKNVNSIGYDGFAFCTNLTEVSFNDNLLSMSDRAFYNCTSLTSIILPESLTTVGESVFEDCKKLSNVKLSEGLPYIGDSMFYECNNLSTIIIPKNVEIICEYAFKYCSSLKVVVCLNPTPPRVISDAFTGASIREAELQVPTYAIEDYKNATVWKNFGTITPLDIEEDGGEILPQSIVISGVPEGPFRPSESVQLSAQILPEDAFSQSVVWSSSNTGVASVTQDGFVIAISPGTTTITVCVEDYPEISSSCEIIVASNIIEAEQLILNVEEVELNEGETLQLEVTILPENTSNQFISWTTSDKNVATVSPTGLVTTYNEGFAVITAWCGKVSASCNIKVVSSYVDVEEIVLNVLEAELNEGESIQLTATVLPENATDKEVLWESSAPDVASVSPIGLVTAFSEGIAIITVRNGLISSSCQVRVVNPYIEAEQLILNYENVEMSQGETLQLTVIVLPEDTTDKTIIWESSNPNVATVSETGMVEAISDGNCLIYVSCGNLTVSCNISVSLLSSIEKIIGSNIGNISIYSIDGILIKKNCKTEDLKSLSKGIYIIVSGNERYKISI